MKSSLSIVNVRILTILGLEESKSLSVYAKKKKKTVSPGYAFWLWMWYLETVEVRGRVDVCAYRLAALKHFRKSHPKDHLKALFEAFRQWKPHWKCTSFFSYENMKAFVVQLSNSNIFHMRTIFSPSPGMAMPKFKTVVTHLNPKRTAKVEKKLERINEKCSACSSKKGLRSKAGPILCRSCAITLGFAQKKGDISKEAKKKEIISFIKRKKGYK
jgi:hypothetical protein